jgi:crotonobetainyl-CoA:carnitine CoA-transferase CaiB-like acyl-CoA transferase
VWGPLDRPVATVDGWLVVSAGADDDYRRLCDACAVSPAARPSTDAAVAARLAARPAAAWEEDLGRAGVACAVAPTGLADIASDPRMAALFEPVAGGLAPASPWSFA